MCYKREEYFKEMFPPVTVADIVKHEVGYKGSNEEKQDVINGWGI